MNWQNEKVIQFLKYLFLSTRDNGPTTTKMALVVMSGKMSVEKGSFSKTSMKVSGLMVKDKVFFFILGFGIFYFANGTKYSGYWENNKKHGTCIF